MTRQEYYSLREDLGIEQRYSDDYAVINRMYQVHPELRHKTLTEIREYYSDKVTEMSLRIEKQLNVQ